MSDLERERREIMHRLEEAQEDLDAFELEHPQASVMDLSRKLMVLRERRAQFGVEDWLPARTTRSPW